MGNHDATHHLTYQRIGKELLEDLQAICEPCHKFTSGKNEYDPCDGTSWTITFLEDLHESEPGFYELLGSHIHKVSVADRRMELRTCYDLIEAQPWLAMMTFLDELFKGRMAIDLVFEIEVRQ